MNPVTRRTFLKTTGAALGGAGLTMHPARLWAAEPVDESNAFGTAALAHTHDLRLPDWGCYNNVYNGLAHVADRRRGLSFELSVFPGFFRREVQVPNVKWESGFHPWEAAPDLSYFCYRYEMLWKDQLFCDVSFSALDERTRVIRSEFVNRTSVTQNVVLHFMAYLYFPPAQPYTTDPLRRSRVILPEGGRWFDAIDYADLTFATPQPRDSLTWAGRRRAEVRDHGFVSGSGIGNGLGGVFGKQAGDSVRFALSLSQPIADAALLLRYRTLAGEKRSVSLLLRGFGERVVDLPASGEFATRSIALGPVGSGPHALSIETRTDVPVELDGFALVEAGRVREVSFEELPNRFVPEVKGGPVPNSVLLKYPDVPHWYAVAWEQGLSEVREFHHSELDHFFRRNVQDHVHKVQVGDRKGHFANVFIRPIVLPPGAARTVYGLATAGDQATVESTLRQTPVAPDRLDQVYARARARRMQFAASAAGEPYRFSQEKMAATLLTNVVYPVYTRRTHIRHNSPGKWWDSLYTWDSGFIGLGLTELDLGRAIDCLNAYTTEPGDPEAAFLHVGTPLPVQIFHFWELWNRTQSRELLEYFYPRLRQYHLFLAGRLGSSTTRRLKSNLLTTWDYFYNTGWDDYPPQKYMHENRLVRLLAPVITTAYTLRTAKFLRVMAKAIGLQQDVATFESDIALWSNAIQDHCWDAQTGYFSYVEHDKEGNPKGIFRHPGGQNFNMGMDGTTPIVAGIGTPEQFRAQLANLTSPRHLWTPIGLSTVDQSADYYRRDGYWNGAVWMPEQWFMWKALLDWGAGDFAFQIARTALDLWKNEVDESYNCFEHFLIDSGRGAGWHQFGALSAPVVIWYAAYYVPGHLTAGFDAWVRQCRWSDGNRAMNAQIEFVDGPSTAANLILAMNPNSKYRVTWNGQRATFRELLPGTLQVEIQRPAHDGRLAVEPV